MTAGLLQKDQIEDAAALCALVFGAHSFSRADFEKALEEGPYDCLTAADADGRLLGFCLTQSTDVTEILEIAVREDARRCGAGSILLSGIPGILKKRGTDMVLLEVREGNLPARKFYEKHGFSAYFVRKNYYDHPQEDAVLMRKEYGET